MTSASPLVHVEPAPPDDTAARAAYEAHRDALQGYDWREWEDLRPELHEAWRASARAVEMALPPPAPARHDTQPSAPWPPEAP